MRRRRVVVLTVVIAALQSACATTATAPKFIEPIATDLSRYSSVSLRVAGDAAVGASAAARESIAYKVGRALTESRSGWLVAESGGELDLQIELTRYDAGDAAARALQAGLGQIHIDGRVTVTDAATGVRLGVYDVSKTFAWGGIYGAEVTVYDIEDTFAVSVAAGLSKE